MEIWEPGNRGGTIYQDPKDELAYWIARAGKDPMIAVPVNLLHAIANRRECNETIVVNGDEDGPLAPMTVRCIKEVGHFYRHSNGFTTWEKQTN